eukprot:UN09127
MPLFSRYPTVRQWPEFFEFSKFGKPNNPQERIPTNLSYYAGNYLAIFGVLFVFTCLLNLFLLFGILLVAGGGFGLKTYLKHQLERAEMRSKTQKRKQQKVNKKYATIFVYIAIIIICIAGNAPLASCVVLSLIIIIGHSLLRKRNLASRATHFMDVYNDFGVISSLADYISEWVDDI